MNWKNGAKLAELLKERYPLSFKAAYPRNIQVPSGYADPRTYSAILIGHLKVVQEQHMNELAHRTAYGIAATLMAHRVPTYFVADEFAQAVANTDLPSDFKFAELKWPLDAQVFVLSDKFTTAYFGVYAPFISVCRLVPGLYPRDFVKPIPPSERSYPEFALTESRIMLDHPYVGAEFPVTYNGSYPLKDGIDVFKTAPWNDATGYENFVHQADMAPKGELTPDQEDAYIQKAQQLAVKLMLALANMPAAVEHGKVIRHRVVNQQGKEKSSEMVSPNMIGRTYRIPRKYAPDSGSRTKPRFKYRRGHFAWQAKRFKNVEFISVDDMPRRSDGALDFDADSVKTDKFRACHERIWLEGFFFDENEGEK